jgi:osmotically-inducible protein OsmY
MVCVSAAENGEVLLTGTVGSPADMDKVESAGLLFGGYRLVDQLTTGAFGGETAANDNSPSAIESRVEQALHSLPRLSSVDANYGGAIVRISRNRAGT